MTSYESDIEKKIEDGDDLPEKLSFSMIKYFWQSNPFRGNKPDTIPKFLRSIEAFKNFTENELRILSKFMHLRKFSTGEVIFNQNDLGVGFYLIYSGYVDITVKSSGSRQKAESEGSRHLITLEDFDYFGELALLQDKSIRNASAISREGCKLLGLFKPDLEELISIYPIVATKLLQSVSLIVANRLFSVTREVRELKYKLEKLESVSESE